MSSVTCGKSGGDLECNVGLGWQGRNAVDNQEYDCKLLSMKILYSS
jgi:hypothetical protein